MFLQCTATASNRSLLHASTTISCALKPKHPTQVIKTPRIAATPVPARDRVIDFGKHRGKMLGTLPSSYLKWVSNNLRARDFEKWAKLADEVLDDPVYRDRMEWEFAQKVLNGDVSPSSSRSDVGAVSELIEIIERFGWDNEDKVGWSKINFGLLGTSKGGRIPRVSEKGELGVESELGGLKKEKVRRVVDGEEAKGTSEEKRRERRERVRLKRGGLGLGSMEKAMGLGYGAKYEDKNGSWGFEDDGDGDGDGEDTFERNQDPMMKNGSPFPGRESLLKKVINSRKRLS
ncbi:Aspartate--tRNA ligase [Actinidia chinensis var. chinensis]|uniref:Aspartate--tRNA ligase n=1 Tax=Actinidia chinensis var. chinensis TaxID=1590841 RepID=A0A2R6QF25_ACTCC|nr:Aspartate--tRNA ligase [Actinidia chinensis var. chinensis]